MSCASFSANNTERKFHKVLVTRTNYSPIKLIIKYKHIELHRLPLRCVFLYSRVLENNVGCNSDHGTVIPRVETGTSKNLKISLP